MEGRIHSVLDTQIEVDEGPLASGEHMRNLQIHAFSSRTPKAVLRALPSSSPADRDM